MTGEAEIIRIALIAQEVRHEIARDVRNRAVLVATLLRECRLLGARFRVLPNFDADGAQRWSFGTRTNLPQCRQHLLEAATLFGGGWNSTRDMSPRAKIRFGDVGFNADFIAAVRRRR